jgi:hypothetical protein
MKYEPLEHHLRDARADQVPLSFAEVERIIGSALPQSARKYQAWWANSPEGHVNAQAWLAAGYRAQRVDIDGEQVIFVRNPAAATRDTNAIGFLDRLRAKLGGTVTVMPGVDLTDPTGAVWDAERD